MGLRNRWSVVLPNPIITGWMMSLTGRTAGLLPMLFIWCVIISKVTLVNLLHPDCLHHCLASDRKALQRIVRTVQYITGAKLPDIQDLYTRWCQRKVPKLVKESSHPRHRVFSLLPHVKRYRSVKSRSKRLLNSFYPKAIRLLNN